MKTVISNKTTAYNSALAGVAGVFAYSILVMLYAVIRSSITIYSIMPSSERVAILWMNGISVAYSVSVFSLLMAIISSVVGVLSGIILKVLLFRFNAGYRFRKTLLISSITAIGLILVLYLVLYKFLKERITFDYAETFLFWFVFPAIIFLVAVIVGAIRSFKQLKIQ